MHQAGSNNAANLPVSRLYTFIDADREFALYFLEGQRLIHELALLHELQGAGFAYLRDVVLSIQPMIAFLKRGEQFGFYIDSGEPEFRLKIEAAQHGHTRSVLIPETFREFPGSLDGLVRLLKLFPGNKAPYESILKADGWALRDVVNHVLRDSFQVHSTVLVSQDSDQSVMLHQLPPLKGEYDYSQDAVRQRRAGLEDGLREVLAPGLHDPEAITEAFGGLGFRALAVREVEFRCRCSHERVVHSLKMLTAGERRSLFEPEEESLEITCEYCKQRYEVSRGDLAGGPDRRN